MVNQGMIYWHINSYSCEHTGSMCFPKEAKDIPV